MSVSLSDIEAAAQALEGFAVKTPLIENPKLNALTGGRIYLKAENLQRTGSFKFRGAWNRISRLNIDQHPGGVVAYSSGNHAQGVAAAAQIKGLPALIVMPSDTPAIKQANTKSYGAEVVLYDRATQSREEIAAELCAKRGAVMVPPFDDPFIIAGQGTAGLEIAEAIKPDAVLVCCSGGGLVSGIATSIKAKHADAEIYSVEPEGFDDMARSLRSGKREVNEKLSGNICDALLTPSPGEMTFPICQKLLAGGLSVSEKEVRAAMGFAWRELKLVVEPGGAVALAAVLAGKISSRDRVIAVVLSGGNADQKLYQDVLAS